MARTTPRPPPTATQTLAPLLRHCPTCGNAMWAEDKKNKATFAPRRCHRPPPPAATARS